MDFERQIEDCQKNIGGLNSKSFVRENQKLLKLQGAVEGLNMLEDPVITKGSAVEPLVLRVHIINQLNNRPLQRPKKTEGSIINSVKQNN